MQISVRYFGGFENEVIELESLSLRNEGGKTTIVNAYVFAITGKTLQGFEPRNVRAPKAEATTVWLTVRPNLVIRRDLKPEGGTQLYVNNNAARQSDLKAFFESEGWDIDLIAAMANVNVLTDPQLTSKDLRSLLQRCDVMEGEEVEEVRREISNVRAKIKEAERYALTTVQKPVRTVETLSISECAFLIEYENAIKFIDGGEWQATTCESCGAPLDEDKLFDINDAYEKACKLVDDDVATCEYNRLLEQSKKVSEENKAEKGYCDLMERAKTARKEVISLTVKMEDLKSRLGVLEAVSLKDSLPDGVNVIFEEAAKNGNVSQTCKLTYNSVPLKSVNRAKRIEICVKLLDRARKNKGMEFWPIIVDNAESISYDIKVDNLIRFTVCD